MAEPKLITEYCLSCLYCRTFSPGEFGRACHYAYDTGKARGCDPGDGCVCRVIATDAERERQNLRAARRLTPPQRKGDRRLDDYIFDERSLT